MDVGWMFGQVKGEIIPSGALGPVWAGQDVKRALYRGPEPRADSAGGSRSARGVLDIVTEKEPGAAGGGRLVPRGSSSWAGHGGTADPDRPKGRFLPNHVTLGA